MALAHSRAAMAANTDGGAKAHPRHAVQDATSNVLFAERDRTGRQTWHNMLAPVEVCPSDASKSRPQKVRS